MNVMGWADAHIARFGDFEALVDGDRSLSSTEAHDASRRLATALLRRGVADERVVLWLPNGIDLVLVFTAVLRVGGTAIVLGSRSPLDEVRREVANPRK